MEQRGKGSHWFQFLAQAAEGQHMDKLALVATIKTIPGKRDEWRIAD
jgi:hypothetical protein